MSEFLMLLNDPLIFFMTFGLAIIITAVYLVLHFIARRTRTRGLRALRIGALAALISHLVFVVYMINLVISESSDPEAFFGLVNIPTGGAPLAVIVFVIASVIAFLKLSSQSNPKGTIPPPILK